MKEGKPWSKDIDLTSKGKPCKDGVNKKHSRKSTSGIEAILKTEIPGRPWKWK